MSLKNNENFIEINELLKEESEENSLVNYANLLSENSLHAGFIEFNNPDFLGGPFFEKYALVCIKDKHDSPYTKFDAIRKKLTFLKSTLSPDVWDQKFRDNVARKDKVVGFYYDESSREYFKDQKERGDRKASYHYATVLCESDTLRENVSVTENVMMSMTGLDMIAIFESMLSKLTTEEIQEQLQQVKVNIANRFKQAALEESGYPTKENPFVVYVYGTDDASWSRTYSSLEDAVNSVESLSLNANVHFLCDHFIPL